MTKGTVWAKVSRITTAFNATSSSVIALNLLAIVLYRMPENPEFLNSGMNGARSEASITGVAEVIVA